MAGDLVYRDRCRLVMLHADLVAADLDFLFDYEVTESLQPKDDG